MMMENWSVELSTRSGCDVKVLFQSIKDAMMGFDEKLNNNRIIIMVK